MRPWPRAILFDFDGVIVNSEPLHFWAYHQTLREEKIDLTEEEYYRELVGMDDRGCIRHLWKLHGRPLTGAALLRVFTRKKEAMAELIERRRPRALPGAEAFVRGLWRNYPLGIYSAALRDEIEAMLEGVALRDCFQVVTSAEDVRRAKPHPEGYLKTMELLSRKAGRKLAPPDCLVSEDAPRVIAAAGAAGFRILGVTTSHNAEALACADYVVRSLEPGIVKTKLPALRFLE